MRVFPLFPALHVYPSTSIRHGQGWEGYEQVTTQNSWRAGSQSELSKNAGRRLPETPFHPLALSANFYYFFRGRSIIGSRVTDPRWKPDESRNSQAL
jgi:hypothetical protein